jgi:hypothetical protein
MPTKAEIEAENDALGIKEARILMNATCDQLSQGGTPIWEVVVEGLKPFDHRRTYQLMAKTDDLAVKDAMALFESEMEALRDAHEDE